MKAVTLLVQAVVVALVSAQAYLTPDNSYKCVQPNGAFCSGVTGNTNIIIRCVDGWGHTDNCNDILSGEAPLGNSWAPCWQSSPLSGGAACSKNGIVYPASVFDPVFNITESFPIPGSVASSDVSSAISTITSLTTSTDSASSTDTTSSTTTTTTTSTRTRFATTVTSYVSDNGTTFTVSSPMTTTSITEGTFSLAAYTTYSSVVDEDTTVYVTALTHINTTVCPESSSTPSTSIFAIASSITSMSPVFTLTMDTTTLNLGPGPVSLMPSNSTMPMNFTVSGANSSIAGTHGATATAVPSSEAGAINASANDNSTVIAPNNTAGPSEFSGVASKHLVINGVIVVFCGLLAVVLL